MKYKVIYNKCYSRIRLIRQLRGLKAKDCAELLGVSKGRWSHIENGIYGKPREGIRKKVADILSAREEVLWPPEKTSKIKKENPYERSA